ncbi:MAG: cellulase family glycosylhydrolase [Planctomycetes bacterium]|nr:cellulase family glycosylhydrolase [Planctomycetota bacterium]
MRFHLVLMAAIGLAACAQDAAGRPPAATPGAVPGAGTLLWRLEPAAVAGLPLPAGGAWVAEGPDGATCLRVTVPAADATAGHVVRIPIDLAPWRGLKVAVTATVAADGVTRPGRNRWNGIKCTLYHRSPSGGESWVQQRDCHGTFPWSEVGTITAIPADAGAGELRLGLEESAGTARFADARLTVVAAPAVRPPPGPSASPPRSPLRGVQAIRSSAASGDLDLLAGWGVSLIRWPLFRNWGQVGTDRDQGEYDAWVGVQIEELQRLLDLAAARGQRVAVNIACVPGGRLADDTMAMFIEKPYQEQYIRTWECIARRFRGHPGVWAYDLLNEPVQNRPSPPGCLDWLGLQVAAARAVRAIDPAVAVTIAPDFGGAVPGFAYLAPVDLANVIYTVHMYWPLAYTHQGVYDRADYQAGRSKPIAYPGSWGGAPFDREALRRHLQPVRDFQLAHGARIYVGEFSAVRWAPGADRYLADCIALCEEYGWDWTYHAFREWDAWSVEHQDLPIDPAQPATAPTARALVLRNAWRRP